VNLALILLLLAASIGTVLVVLAWAVSVYRTTRSPFSGLVLLWALMLIGSDLLRVTLETEGPSTRTSALLTVALLGFLVAQVLIMRALFASWVGPVLDVFLTGVAVIVTGWSLLLLFGGVWERADALGLLDLATSTWLLAAVAKKRAQLPRLPLREAAEVYALPVLHLAGVVLLLARSWGFPDVRLVLAVLLFCGSYVSMALTLSKERHAPIKVTARSSRRDRLLPYVLVLAAMVVALAAAVVHDDTAVRSPLFFPVCLGVAIGLSLRQIQVTEANATLADAMTERERLYRGLVQDSTNLILIADIDGRLEYVSPAVDSVLGVPTSQLVGRPVGEVLAIAQDDFLGCTAKARDTKVPQRLDSRLTTAGVTRSLESVVSVRGRTVVLNVRDVTERSQLREQLRDMAFHDPLTGLINRARLLQILESKVADWRVHGGNPPAVLFLDLDGFKGVNDVAGHAAGDKVLRLVAERLTQITPVDAVLARLGGDEFVVLLTSVTPPDALVEAERIAEEVSQSYAVDEGSFVIGVSIGVAHAADVEGTEDLLRNADLAMYTAKRGRHAAQAFDPSMHVAAVRRADDDLLHAAALDEKRTELHYQPVVDLETERPVGVEALLRWRNEEGELGHPGRLLEYAERSGRMAGLSTWVLSTALDQVADWREDLGLVPVSVNLAPVELLRRGLIRSLRDELAVRGLPPDVLTIEITEQVLMQDPARAIRVISDLRSLGIRISIDDFGTGFSSLAYLVDLPVDVLKIDRSFVQALPRTPTARVVVTRIIDMARDLNIEVIAEGIETVEQRALLARLGNPLCQGDLFSPPVPADAVAELIRSAKRAQPLQTSAYDW